MEEDIAETQRLQKILEKIVLEKTKIGKKKLKEAYTGKLDWFISAKEAINLKIIEEII